ncbi:hypothetical protein QBC47DRAFT_427171 [Echria macrotheca]|uniref:ubiquitinyl hydrolase 1 n=1 Tax=Echria macrotheca TaxID=438768 RepID=A0AAJ0FFR7_9PEZI|nr:hypothetical protein QBC47DRAFT_427171 [Echria macrotheca]
MADRNSAVGAVFSLDYIVNQVFLPPRPAEIEDAGAAHDLGIVRSFRESLVRFSDIEPNSARVLAPVLKTLDQNLRARAGVDAGGNTSRKVNAIKRQFRDLETGDYALFHIRAQNAGLLLTMEEEDVVFEAFELLAPNSKVTHCRGALLREFPDSAAIISREVIRDDRFLTSLADTMCHLENERPPSRFESGASVNYYGPENNTTSPSLVTEMLMDVLRGIGEDMEPLRITKRSREQATHSRNGTASFRSSTWVLLRVSVRMILERSAPEGETRDWYKEVMAHYHGFLLSKAVTSRLKNDFLFCMGAKTAHRVAKIDPSDDSPWLEDVRASLNLSRGLMESRWRNAQRQNGKKINLEGLSHLPFYADCNLKIQTLKSHLEWIDSRVLAHEIAAGPGDHTVLVRAPKSSLPPLDFLRHKEGTMQHFQLREFESWIELNLQPWLGEILQVAGGRPDTVEDAANQLWHLIETYHRKAREEYKHAPEALSNMYLCILEAWVAVDKLACRVVPLLLEYNPEINPEICHPLLLGSKEQMIRIHQVETYLYHRKSNTPSGYLPTFDSFGEPDSFAVRYFNSSIPHQNLLARILADAEAQREAKWREYDALIRKAKELSSKAEHTPHRVIGPEKIHQPHNCPSCELSTQAQELKISIFEWPLPADQNEAKAVVFEISVPKAVAAWRNATISLLANILSDPRVAGWPPCYVATYPGLTPFVTSTSRLQPGCDRKTWRKDKKYIFEVSRENVCTPHAYRYSYYDAQSNVACTRAIEKACVPESCSYAVLVQEQPLQFWVRSTEHTSNEVIASQNECPGSMSLKEFRSFGHIRSGLHLQWANVLCQLTIPSLDFNRTSVFALVVQACLEAGPASPQGSVLRCSHIDTSNEAFFKNMEVAITDALDRISESWRNSVALSVLTRLATRLLSLAPSRDASISILRYLTRIRGVSIGWAWQLAGKMEESKTDPERAVWKDKLLLVSLICASTFDVGQTHIDSIFCDSREVSLFSQAAVFICDHCPVSNLPRDPLVAILVTQWYRVMSTCESSFKEEVTTWKNDGLNDAIKRFWADYSPSGTGWKCRPGNQAHVLETTTGRTRSELRVTFNALTGQVLADGYPLSRLPEAYQSHPSFIRLAGTKMFKVMPSTMAGMRFSSCHDHYGWVIHFTMIGGKMVIRTARKRGVRCEDTEMVGSDEATASGTWEYVDPDYFSGDLPESFIEKYSHWINLSTKEIEFRPIGKPWVSSEENWRLARSNDEVMLSKGSRYVIDPHSSTAKRLYKIFAPIERPEKIDLIFNNDARKLLVELPRLGLSFSLSRGDTTIWSKNYTGMQVDHDQGLGTLIGLKNRLILREDVQHSTDRRLVLVPRGTLSSRQVYDHVDVLVSPSGSGTDPVRHDAFTVDTHLGQLRDSGALHSKVFLCLLHALTSNCLLDPLTGRTGTEEALRILRSSAVRSYQFLDPVSHELLVEVARLSPIRTTCNRGSWDIERVEWNETQPILSQHEDFWVHASSIIEDARRFNTVFRPVEMADEARSVAHWSEKGLVERAQRRNGIFRAAQFGGEACASAAYRSWDEWYRGDRPVQGTSPGTRQLGPLVRCLLQGDQSLLTSPENRLQQDIIRVSGIKFPGTAPVDIKFSVQNLHKGSLMGKWCAFHHALAAEGVTYRSFFFLGSLLYSEGAEWEVVQALMAIASIEDFSEIRPPRASTFDLDVTRSSILTKIETTVVNSALPFEKCPEQGLARGADESEGGYKSRMRREWERNLKRLQAELSSELKAKCERTWRIAAPESTTAKPFRSYFDLERIVTHVNGRLNVAHGTHLFRRYLDQLVQRMRQAPLMPTTAFVRVARTFATQSPPAELCHFSVKDLLSQPAPNIERPSLEFISCSRTRVTDGSIHTRLYAVLDRMLKTKVLGDFQRSYIEELRRSAQSSGPQSFEATIDDLDEALKRNLEGFRLLEQSTRRDIDEALKFDSIAAQMCRSAGVYPRVSSIFLLGLLSREAWGTLSEDWKKAVVNFALTIIYLQRAERLLNSGSSGQQSELKKELLNQGAHHEFDPMSQPEALLLEVEQEILIRPVQQTVARHMRDPPHGNNSVMQLNMGEGKSSVIVPLVASILADGKRLVRVVVARPQSKQMAHTLISKLGGLINRRLFYLPFSRSVNLGSKELEILRNMCKLCVEEGGVLLVQPEHILSLKLMGVQKSWVAENDEEKIGARVVRYYEQMEKVSRDIVDESDENFSVKFELIYTMGSQQPVEMSPDRWILIQEVLGIVLDVAREEGELLEAILLEENGYGRFPTIRILDENQNHLLTRAVAERVCRFGLRGFPIHNQTPRLRDAAMRYMLHEDLEVDEVAAIEENRFGMLSEAHTMSTLLLLRGLLAKGVLAFVLARKRYRVNYGLAPDRRPETRLAVPYRAKDMPSPRSEFSHPEVIIVLTCLTYYYRGLKDGELYQALEILSLFDQGDQEFQLWIVGAWGLPSTLRHLSAVNVKDKKQCETVLFPAIRFQKAAIDFYLSNVVFSKEMKEFPWKLSASGWDLARRKPFPLTGFSGTNDSKHVLPSSVKALDLPEQRHTNAAVLSCLLREENTVLELGSQQSRRQSGLSVLTADMLLAAVTQSERPIRVILDVGAQIIELSNLQMAQRWLDMTPENDTDAVIFFSEDDDLSVVTREGTVDDFLTSPFASRTDRCLVFLDQAHTRGTDLKLPQSYRAAVTLGPGVTKDTLVQACMRMRKLGQGQSVTFCVSPEMQNRIRETQDLLPTQPIDVGDIVAWAVSETWDEAVRSVPLWAAQGIRHLYQETIWDRARRSGGFSPTSAKDYLEDEALSISHRYRPAKSKAKDLGSPDLLSKLESRMVGAQDPEELVLIKTKCEEFRLDIAHCMGNLQEEQERELAPEVEEERELERPAPREPGEHSLHPDVVEFVRTGILRKAAGAFLRPYMAMSKTRAAKYFKVSSFPADLLITADFASTVDESGNGFRADMYQRPVQWVLTSYANAHKAKHGMQMVIISQWEANKLKAVAASSTSTKLHVYLPRHNRMFRSMEDLKAYVVPMASLADGSWAVPKVLVMHLNLFAGQLYLRTYEDYIQLCRYLGLAHQSNDGSMRVSADGFIGRQAGNEECVFVKSPITFLNVLFRNIRHDSVSIEKTHLARILSGEILSEEDFHGCD